MSAEINTPGREAFAHHLEYLSSGRIREWVDLFTEDGVLEFPYGPPGYQRLVQGHEGLYEYMKNFPDHFEVKFQDLRFHETVDPTVVIAEFESRGVAKATGKPYDQVYISVVYTTAEGKITRYVDFWNPMVAIEALDAGGSADDMVKAFGS